MRVKQEINRIKILKKINIFSTTYSKIPACILFENNPLFLIKRSAKFAYMKLKLDFNKTNAI